jgi:hypothetical protein
MGRPWRTHYGTSSSRGSGDPVARARLGGVTQDRRTSVGRPTVGMTRPSPGWWRRCLRGGHPGRATRRVAPTSPNVLRFRNRGAFPHETTGSYPHLGRGGARHRGAPRPRHERVLAPARGRHHQHRLPAGRRVLLRVPRDHPAHVAQAEREAIAAPAARAAGPRTPPLVTFDARATCSPCRTWSTGASTGRRWACSTWSRATPLGPGESSAATSRCCTRGWRRIDRPGGSGRPRRAPSPTRALTERRGADGWFTRLEARWLLA